MGNGEALFLHGQFRMDNFDQFQDTQTEFADNIEILRGVFINRMVRVFPERDIQMPMHNLYGPMLAHGPAEKRNVRFQTADKVAIFYRHASVLPLQRLLFHASAFETGPFGASRHPVDIFRLIVFPDLFSPVSLFRRPFVSSRFPDFFQEIAVLKTLPRYISAESAS